MKRISVFLISAVVLGALGIAFAGEEANRKKTDAVEAQSPADPCESFCIASLDLPVYVPPNRGAPPARIAAGTRGGDVPIQN